MSSNERDDHSSLARGAAAITLATAASRATGFVRVVVVAGAMGTTFLANTYQTANTAPNLLFELVAAGVLTSVFVPTFVDYLVTDRKEEGWRAANALTSVALVALIGMSLLLALAAPLIMRALTLGVRSDGLRDEQIALGTTFLRLFAPQVIFYGAGMVMTAAMHANRRFAMPAIAPIFNNLVVIAVYLAYAAMRGDAPPTVEGISSGETFLLGAGTTAGVVAMTICLIPQLRRLGWRFRFDFDTDHPAVRKGARLGAWALGYAGGYQAGLIVVLVLANRVEGGVAAYQWAYTFFYLPHALFGVPIFNVVFTAMSERAALRDDAGLASRLEEGLRMLYFILVPVAAILLAAAGPLSSLTLDYGAMTSEGSDLVARVLAAFAIGLPAYSAFLVFTRAFYAIGDTKTPALLNAAAVAMASFLGAVLFDSLPDRWEVAGLALGHTIGFSVVAWIAGHIFYTRSGLGGEARRGSQRESVMALKRALGASAVALIAMVALRLATPDDDKVWALAGLLVTGGAGGLIYVVVMRWIGAPELERLTKLVRRVRS